MKSNLLAAASLAALFAATPALAQDAAPSDDSEEAIIVTAQYREQDPVEVPFALTAYSAETLDQLGIEEFEELAEFVPGFEVQNQSPNNPAFVMRGLTSDSGDAYNEPRVSIFQDGVSISKSRGSYVELFDVERVEIAKGPQSTLYGRGALIGAVNIVQNKAEVGAGDFAARVGYGNFDSWIGEAMINAPIGDNAALRISGRAKHRDGYVENLLGGPDFNSTDTYAIRGALRAQPSERVTIDVIANYQKDRPSGTSFKSLTYNPTDLANGALLGSTSPDDGAALAASRNFVDGTRLGLNRDVFGVTGLASFELSDALTLNSVTAYREFDALEVFDADGIALPVLTASEQAIGEQFSQELRLSFDDGGRVRGFIGGSYFKDNGSQRVPTQFDERLALARLANALNGGIPGRAASDPAPQALLTSPQFGGTVLQGLVAQALIGRGVPAAAAPAQAALLLPTPIAQAVAGNLNAAFVETSVDYSETESFDLFGDLTLALSDRFEIGAGLRYTMDDKRTGLSSALPNGRSIINSFQYALGLTGTAQQLAIGCLATPGAATRPTSATCPIPLLGLTAGPTANNGGVVYDELDDSGLTWRVNARFAVNEDTSIYGNYARGRRPEVLEASVPAISAPFTAPTFDIIDAETVDSFELGFKTAMSRSLFFDSAVFYQLYKNFQTTVLNGTSFATINAGKATSYGYEGQLRWSPTSWVDLRATYAYNHGRFTTGARDGNRFRLSPDHSASLAANFEAPAGPGTLHFRPSVTWQSSVFFDDDNDLPALQANRLIPDLIQDEYQDGYALVNARLGYTFADPEIRIEAFVDNLFDESYIKDAGNSGDSLGMPTFISGEPRMYGVQASVRF